MRQCSCLEREPLKAGEHMIGSSCSSRPPPSTGLAWTRRRRRRSATAALPASPKLHVPVCAAPWTRLRHVRVHPPLPGRTLEVICSRQRPAGRQAVSGRVGRRSGFTFGGNVQRQTSSLLPTLPLPPAPQTPPLTPTPPTWVEAAHAGRRNRVPASPRRQAAVPRRAAHPTPHPPRPKQRVAGSHQHPPATTAPRPGRLHQPATAAAAAWRTEAWGHDIVGPHPQRRAVVACGSTGQRASGPGASGSCRTACNNEFMHK